MNSTYPQLTLQTVKEAMQRISPLVHQSPLQSCRSLSEVCGHKVYLKLENMQKTGSFKIRGAANKIFSLSQSEAACGVISASAGNHAQGVAWAASACGVAATVVMPRQAPLAKIRATEAYGARVVLHGANYDEAYQHARTLQAEQNMTFIHAFDDDGVIAGQGTIALEILEKMPETEVLVAAVGGGGLLSGLAAAAKALKPGIKIIGVQAAGAPAMAQSLAQDSLVTLPSVKTLADGIAVKCPGKLTFNYLKKYVDDMVLVDEEEIKAGIMFMLERGKIITEGAGAAGVAALLAGKIAGPRKNTAVVVSGGNIDPMRLSEIIAARCQQAASF